MSFLIRVNPDTSYLKPFLTILIDLSIHVTEGREATLIYMTSRGAPECSRSQRGGAVNSPANDKSGRIKGAGRPSAEVPRRTDRNISRQTGEDALLCLCGQKCRELLSKHGLKQNRAHLQCLQLKNR